jgi:hypothetical protein
MRIEKGMYMASNFFFRREQHDIAMGGPWVNDILAPSDVIGCVVKSGKFVLVHLIEAMLSGYKRFPVHSTKF